MSKIEVRLNPDSLPSGSDLAVVNAARRSFNSRSEWDYSPMIVEWADGTRTDYGKLYPKNRKLKEKDKRLIEFLARGMTAKDFDDFCEEVELLGEEEYKEKLIEMLWQWRNTAIHDTPFNHCFVSFELKIPMFTARQLVKTEYTPLSEISRRYIKDNIEFYEHDYRLQSEDKKQGSYGEHENNGKWQALSRENAERAITLYNKMVDDGVAIEQARGELPANLMVEWTWSGTLGAFAKMCRERRSPDAQKEAQIVANEIYEYLVQYYPVSAKALVEGVK